MPARSKQAESGPQATLRHAPMTSPRTTLGTLAAWLLNLTEGRGIVRLGIIGACLAVQTMTCAAADSKTVLARDDRQAPREQRNI